MTLIMIMIGFDSICLNGRKDGRFCFSRRGTRRGPPIFKGACKGSIVGMQSNFGGLHISWETSTAPQNTMYGNHLRNPWKTQDLSPKAARVWAPLGFRSFYVLSQGCLSSAFIRLYVFCSHMGVCLLLSYGCLFSALQDSSPSRHKASTRLSVFCSPGQFALTLQSIHKVVCLSQEFESWNFTFETLIWTRDFEILRLVFWMFIVELGIWHLI